MGLLKFIVQRKILVVLLVCLILILGTYAMTKLDKELFPSIDFDVAYVEVDAGELAAIEVERNITSPLESRLQTIQGVERIVSSSGIGRSSIQLMLEAGSGEDVLQELDSIVNSTTNSMSQVNEVYTGLYGTNQDYEFFMDISDGNMEEMSYFAKNIVKPRLESLREVRDVSIVGLEEKEMLILFNREELQKNDLSIPDVLGEVQKANSEVTMGQLIGEVDTPTVRWNSSLHSINDVKEIKIPLHTGGSIQLSSVATVSLQEKESASSVWKNGSKDFIFIEVGRAANTTQIEMAEAIREEVNLIFKEGLVDGFSFNEVVAQADYVQDSIEGVTSNIVIGAIIAIVILLLFLRNIRATFIIGLSIPTSILLTFLTMWLLDYSFNMLTLIGLGLGIGMMVDSSIVILESIYRKKEQGYHHLQAVLEGTKEVATAVIASMLTTIVVFLPIGIIGGEMGQFVLVLSAVVAITLISSVIVAFTLIPSLSEKLLTIRKNKGNKRQRIMNTYGRLISWTVRKKRHSALVILMFFSLFVGSLFLITKIPMTIMPDVLNRYAEIGVEIETGVTPSEKQTIVSKVSETVAGIQDVESNYVMDNGNLLYLIINMTKDDDVTREQKEVNEEISRSLRSLQEDYPIRGVFSLMDGGGGSPVQLNIKGENFDTLSDIADDVINNLNKIDGVVGTTNSMERMSTQEMIHLNELALEEDNISKTYIMQFIEQQFSEFPLGEINSENEMIDLVASLEEPIEIKSDLLNLPIQTLNGEKKLSDYVRLETVNVPNEIRHENGERFLSITADIEGTDLGTINREVQSLIENYEVPAEYTVSVAGDLEAQQELMMEMLLVLVIAIFLVYLVMAVQFNHFIHPFIVMSVIPMTIVGVIAGLFITQRELSVISAMGVIMLIGIVLNNAILLIDRTNKLRLAGYSMQEAIIEAGKNRIRPIFMTTFTTAGGMLPLALAVGTTGNYQAPMATVIISGLLFSTFITLLLIPAVYRLISSATSIFKRRKNKDENKEIVKHDNNEDSVVSL
ncbi:efflux RND transporter permease subunit [Evansella cellulosilytica]|uniref:Acriflavin resistance protein n=1 Tax=Evansella cellulosilytica (strain ATCC 21833 / DSM 2522 / FERM P-1141 / JCM 9156 / N-4) TaxID=649639 RepID=E6TR83_EVAC2|nr:efflux RND transporter permease subunit [Evansella cellulosilytica]ADU30595.1 acriflavin resistance protein [Evansella cellulosilytica DSM 2522]